jgi:hypothetical protein
MLVPLDDISLGIGIAENLVCLSPDFGGTLPLPSMKLLATAFYSLAAGMSILLTSAISFKLLLYKRRMSNLTSGFRSSHAPNVVGVVGILVESAVFYSGSCLIFVILDTVNSPSRGWFGGILSSASVSMSLPHDTRYFR